VFKNQYAGSIDTASAIILAVGKPLMAKLADVYVSVVEFYTHTHHADRLASPHRFGRAEAYVIVMTLYIIGYVCKASAQGVGALAGGQMVYA
jgi:hypothetical protein